MSKDVVTLKASSIELKETIDLLLFTNEYDYVIVKFDRNAWEYTVEAHIGETE